MKLKGVFILVFSLLLLLPGCQMREGGMHEGYYTAEASQFDDEGWKDFLTIYVTNDKIVTIEFNAYNEAGFLRTWDPDYQRRKKEETGLHPSEYLRRYTSELLSLQNPEKVLVVAGAEHPHRTFQLLTEAAINQAKAGDESVILVELS
jgi:major membrane immunogen (membrane-anchored lipoprotein)